MQGEIGPQGLQGEIGPTGSQGLQGLSAILLIGLGLNAWVGWWWADPAAALVMVPIIAKEGVQALRGEHCDDGCA